MVAELRAKQAEVDARRHFTKEGQPIDDVRSMLAEWTEPAPERDLEQVALTTAGNMRSAAESGFIEVG
jgi:hypothetical protein